MIPRVIKKAVDLYKLQKIDKLDGPLYELENGGHTFEIRVMKGLSPATLSGTVGVRFIRADNVTVSFTGSLSENTVSVTLPQSCYTVPGHFGMVVFVSGSGTTDAVYACAGHVARSTSDAIIDPEENIPSLEELLAQIEACENATNAANAAAANATSAAQSGVRTDTAEQGLTDTQKSNARTNIDAVSQEEHSNLKQAFDEINGAPIITYEIGRINPDTGMEESSTVRIRSSYIPALDTTEINVDTGYRVIWVAYDSNKSYVNGRTTFYADGESFTIKSVVADNPTTAFIRLVYRRTDGTQISQTDLANVETFVIQASRIDAIQQATDNNSNILNGNIGTDNFNSELQQVFLNTYETIALTFSDGYMTISGTLDTSSSTTHYAAIAVTEGERYRITTRHGSALRAYVLIDTDGNIVNYYPSGTVSTITDTVDVLIPVNGVLYVNAYTVSVAAVQKASGLVVKSSGEGLAGKTWYALGDSITNYAQGYHSIIAAETGVLVTNGGVSGSGYMKPINNKTFVDRANLSEIYNIVTVFGSVNDMQYVAAALGTESDTGTETLGGCFNTLIDNLYASGNYHIGIIAPIPQGTASGNPINTTGTFAQYTELLEKVCKRRGVPYLDLWHCSNMQPWDSDFASEYMQDETHPNTKGHAIFEPRIKAFIKSL